MRFSLTRINIFLVLLYVVAVFPLWSAFLRNSDGGPAFLGLNRGISAQRQEVQERAKMTMLNILMPGNFSGLAGFVTQKGDSNGVDWGSYLSYFQYAASVLPAPLNADAYAVSGFCQFHQGKDDEALVNYRRALEINPIFLANYYNLAVLQFRAGDYAQASELIGRMLALNPELSFKWIASSKIYADILREASGFDLTKTAGKLFSDALRLLIISQYRLGQFEQVTQTMNFARRSGFAQAEFFDFYAVLAAGASERSQAEYFLNQMGNPKSEFYSGRDIAPRLF